MTNEAYTLVHRGNFGSVEFTCFIDREKMKKEMLRHIQRGDECYILPGVVDFVGFNVRRENDRAASIHMEDKPCFLLPLSCSSP